MKNASRTDVVAGRTFVTEPDPAMLGKRGAVYGWRVRDEASGRVVFDSHDRVPCLAWVTGFEAGVIEGKYGAPA